MQIFGRTAVKRANRASEGLRGAAEEDQEQRSPAP